MLFNKSPYSLLLLFILLLGLAGCNTSQKINPLANTYAWCIVNFDQNNRSPQERISMLKELNFTKYAYDWEEKHLDSMAFELEHAAAENNIDVIGVWLWIDDRDSSHILRKNNRRVFEALKKVNYNGEVWVGLILTFLKT